jgi:hypothetical protein
MVELDDAAKAEVANALAQIGVEGIACPSEKLARPQPSQGLGSHVVEAS